MKIFIISCMAVCCVLLTGCDPDLKRSIGVTKSEPNEYAVLKRPPLHVPPKFDLVPPEEQQKESVYLASHKGGKSQIDFGSKKKSHTHANISLTNSDKKFVNQSKKFDKNPNIKQLIEVEHENDKKVKVQKPKTLVEAVFSSKS